MKLFNLQCLKQNIVYSLVNNKYMISYYLLVCTSEC